MTQPQRMTGRIIRIAALAVAAALLILMTYQALRSAAREAARQDLAEAAREAGGSLGRQARELDLAAARSLRAIERSGGFAPALEPVAEALAPRPAFGQDRSRSLSADPAAALAAGLRLTLLGAAEFHLRGGDARLRRSFTPQNGDSHDAGAGPSMALRAAAGEIAAKVAALGDAGSRRTERAFVAADHVAADRSDGGAPRFWAVWAGPSRDRALALLLEAPSATTTRAGGARMQAAIHAEPTFRAAPGGARLWAQVDVPLAGDTLGVRVWTEAPLLSSQTWRAAALALISALLVGFAIVVHAETTRARALQLDRRNQAILRTIDAKQRALEASEDRFRHLAESTNVIPWTADLDQQRFTYVGPQIEQLSGYAPQSWLASGFWAQHIHPVDRNETLRQAVELTSGGRYTTLDYRVRAADGRTRHVRNMMTVDIEEDAGGRPRWIARGFMLDVTELRQAAAALEVARRKAEEANRVKSEFLANMSHELRTPLNAVIGFSEIMKDELFGPIDPRYREYAESVHASGQHLLELINDVLDLSKIEAGRIELVEEPSDLGDLLRECRTLLQERIHAGGLHDRLDIDADLPAVSVDERRMKQVVLNLLSNAVKFTPPGGELTLSARRRAGRGVVIAVRDTGIGMAPNEVPRALSKFGQIDGELARMHDGTGLGLPIAKSLVEMHGGVLEIWSEKGKGTEMRIVLPESRLVRAREAVDA